MPAGATLGWESKSDVNPLDRGTECVCVVVECVVSCTVYCAVYVLNIGSLAAYSHPNNGHHLNTNIQHEMMFLMMLGICVDVEHRVLGCWV